MEANLSGVWHIDLLGTLTLRNGQESITRFRTQKTAALLGFLAYELRPHPREEVISLLWPEANLENGRNSLSVSLSSLRRQLEPPGTKFGSVLVADRNLVSLDPATVTTDIQRFFDCLNLPHKAARSFGATDPNPEKQDLRRLQSGIDLYGGRFLAGLYEDWIEREGEHLENLWLRALDLFIEALQKKGDSAVAQHYAERGISVAPWREASHRNLMSTLIAQGQDELARRHYQAWINTGTEEAATPSPALHALLQKLQTQKPPFASAPPVTPANDLATPAANEPPLTPDLPLQRTRFFGRRALLSRLVKHFSSPETASATAIPPASLSSTGVEAQLVTLTGIGGSGKTRLALEVAHAVRGNFGSRMWFVPLSGLLDGSLLDVAVRDSLQIKPHPNVLPLDQIVDFLASETALLVLDNFESLLPAGATFIASLLFRLPRLHCLVTSRQKLEVEGELEVPLRPLPVPRKTTSRLNVQQLLRFASIRLFVDRAKAARPDFALTHRNTAAVTNLCLALEGVPLALELAAARSGVHSPAQLLEQVEQLASQTELPPGLRPDLPARHRSMHSAIDASYRLLPPELQQFFRTQSVFRGGWRPSAAAIICQELRALHFAAQLRAASLLNQMEQAEEVRFSSLEILREFADAQLESTEKASLQKRHALYFLAHLEAEPPPKANALTGRTVANFRADLNNYRAALEWAMVAEPLLALQLALALRPWWETLGYLAEGRVQLERALTAAPHAPLSWRARAYFGAGKLVYQQDLANSRPFYETSLEIYRELGDLTGTAELLCALSLVTLNLGEAQAESLALEALTLARQVENSDLEFQATFCVSSIRLGRGETTSARPMLQSSLAYYRQEPDKNASILSQCLDALGMLTWQLGEWKESKALFQESLALARQLEHGWLCAHSLWGVAAIAREEGDFALAIRAARESIVFARDGRFLWFVPYLIANLAYAQLEIGLARHALPLLAAAETQHEVLKMPLVPLFVPNHEKYLAKSRAILTSAEFNQLWQKGRSLDFDQAIALALKTADAISNQTA